MENETKNELITKGSDLIAQFMGLTPNPHDGGKTWANEVTYINGEIYGDNWWPLHYSTSWDWLMPVVQKIESMGCIVEMSLSLGGFCRIVWIGKKMECAINFKNQDNELIKCTYQTVLDFIKWYNETQSRGGGN